MLKPLFSILVVISLAGCASTTTTPTRMSDHEFDTKLLKTMKTWEGSHISQLIQKVGPPTYKTPDEAGGTIYIWMIDPSSLPATAPLGHIQPPLNIGTPLQKAANRFLYQQRIQKRLDHQHEIAHFRQRMLAMKRMFYVRPDGTIYLANLMYQ